MKASCSTFRQVLKLVLRVGFGALLRVDGAESDATRLGSRGHFGSHLGIATPTSGWSLAFAKSDRSRQLFERALYRFGKEGVRAMVRSPRKRRLEHKLVRRGSIVSNCGTGFNWVTVRQSMGAMKPHLMLGRGGYLSCGRTATDGRVHCVKLAQQLVKLAQQLNLPPSGLIVGDNSHNGCRLFAECIKRRVFCVTRTKSKAQHDVVENRDPPQNRGVRVDQTASGTTSVFLTNHLRLGT